MHLLSTLLFTFISWSSPIEKSDEFIWLEDVESPRSIEWVQSQNAKTLPLLQNDPRYKKNEARIKEVVYSKDRIPSPIIFKDTVYNVWSDDKNQKGILRKCSLQEFQKKSPQWETLIDFDELGRQENVSWVFKGFDILKPSGDRALISLSRGGKDALEVREFDLEKKEFVRGGFFVPEAKSQVTWLDRNTLLVGTEIGENSLTTSGYPRQLRLWSRGQALLESPLIFEIPKTEMSVSGYTLQSENQSLVVIHQQKNFYSVSSFLLNKGQVLSLPLPDKHSLTGILDGRLYFQVDEVWNSYPAGSLLSMDINKFLQSEEFQTRLEFAPHENLILSEVLISKSKVWLQIMENVQPSIYQLESPEKIKALDLPRMGTASFSGGNETTDVLFISYSNFLSPSSLYLWDNGALSKIKSIKSFFEEAPYMVEQLWATSKDGTRIPYFVARKKDLPMNSQNPTLLYGYGGFMYSLTPRYLGHLGTTWLEEGGIYVQANIRGGGEFGPAWHESALKENRQKAYDDFIAIAEDLIARKMTSPQKLAIQGGSNGGLLVGAVTTQRPDLFKAVVCEVPLLDMIRYHHLLAGASWMAEYGNPDDPKEREFLLKYSPYQNVRPSVSYPKVLFMTSTKDDRVHPGHARKMAALFEKLGLPFLFFENTEGGHGASADLSQKVRHSSLIFTFLKQELFEN